MGSKRTAPKGRPTNRREGRPSAQRARTRRRERLQWAVVGLVGLGIVAAVGVLSFSGQESQAGATEADDWDLPAVQGEGRVALSDFSGEPLVVNFYASWCTECDRELPYFSTISREVEGQVTFVAVNSLESGSRTEMPERHGIDWWPLARDIKGNNGSGLHDELGVRPGSMPATAFYDTEGNLLDVVNGSIAEADLRANLERFYGVSTGA